MRQLIYYEFRKHFMTPVMLMALLVLLTADAWKIYSVYLESSLFSGSGMEKFKEAYEELYPVYGGEITLEKINALLGLYRPVHEAVKSRTASTKEDDVSYTYNVYSDELFFRKCFLEEMEYDYTYGSYAAGIVSEAKKNMRFYGERGNRYGYRMNLYIAEAFQGRKIRNFYNTEMYQSLLYYDFSSVLLLLIAVYGCTSVFVKEEETEMKYIVRTSRNGRGRTYLAKVSSAILFLAAAGCLFAVWDFCVFASFFGGTECTDSPLYALEGFRDTLLNLSMGQGYMLISVLKIMGLCVFGMIFMLLSLAAGKILGAFVLNMISVMVCVSVYDRFYGGSRLWNPISFISGRNLILRSDFVNLAGYPVPWGIAAVCIAAFLFTGLGYAGWVLWRAG